MTAHAEREAEIRARAERYEKLLTEPEGEGSLIGRYFMVATVFRADIDYLLEQNAKLERVAEAARKDHRHTPIRNDRFQDDFECECGRARCEALAVIDALDQPQLVVHHGPNENPLMTHTCSCGRYECPEWKEQDEVHG